jgi:hypothetical protein
MAELRPLFPVREGQSRRSKAVDLPRFATRRKPCRMRKKKPIAAYVTRCQVVIARPPAPTSPRRYRRSLVSKGHFTASINAICVGTCSSLPKRRYRVGIYYVATRRAMTRERIWGRGSSELSVVCGFSWLRAIDHGKHEAAPLDPNTKHGFFDAAGAAGREREPRGAGAPKGAVGRLCLRRTSSTRPSKHCPRFKGRPRAPRG